MFYPEWMRRQTWAAEAITNICDVIGDVRHVLDAQANRATIPIGSCPENGCIGQVRIRKPWERGLIAVVDCTDCDRTWGATEWVNLTKRMSRGVTA